MKKTVTLLLALVLSLSLTVPALAAGLIMLEDETLSGEHTYNDMVVMYGNTTVEKNAVITFNQMANVSGPLTVEAGASLTANGDMPIIKNGSLMVEAGATVTTNGNMTIDGKVTVGGKLKGKGGLDTGNGNISLLPGGEVDVVLDYEYQADKLVSKLLENGEEKVSVNMEQTKDGYYHVTAHGHDFEDGVCAVCGVSAQNSHEEVINGEGGEGAPASTLSQGSATVVCTIAAFVLGFAAATVIFTRKKTKG